MSILSRVRWLEWTNVVLWGLLGGYGYFCVPRLEPIFASFGSDLPASTLILLRARPFFIVPFAAAVIRAAFMLVFHDEKPLNPRLRKALWIGVAAALLAAYGTVSAIFAPMFMGSLAGTPSK